MSTTVKFSDPDKIITRLGLKPGGDTHKYFMKRAADRMKDYLPFRDKGSVVDAQTQGIDFGKGQFVYNLPYARYLYLGKVVAGTPRRETDKDLVYTKQPHPKAGPYWDRRMMANEGRALGREVTKHLGGK